MACKSIWECPNSNVWRDFSWKCLMRFFITPNQMTYWHTGTLGCWRKCGAQEAGHWHIFWDCSKIKPFWHEFHKALITIFKANNIPLQFSTIFLTNLDHLQDMRNKYLFMILVTAAKKAVTRCRLLPAPPTMSDWRDIVNEIYAMEIITFSICLKKNVFAKLWCEWVNFIKPLQPDFVEISSV